MTKDEFYQKYKRWTTQCHSAAETYDLDDAVRIISFDEGQTATTLSDVAVRAIAVHTDRIHVFLFAVRTVWSIEDIIDGVAERGEELDAQYKLFIAF